MKTLRLIRLNTENSFHAPDCSVKLMGKAVAPPLGLLTVATLFEQHGYSVTVTDGELDKIDWKNIPEDLVGISCMLHNYEKLVEGLDALRLAGKTTLVGGSVCYECPEDLADRASVVVVGEFEALAADLIRDLDAGVARGIYRASALPKRSDGIPAVLPAFRLVDMKRYIYGAVQTQRGCPNRCNFCQIPHWFGTKIRTKSKAAVLGELDAQVRQGTRFFIISDDNFVADRKYAADLLDEVIAYQEKNRVKLHFFTQIAIDVARHDELLRKMQAAGFFWLFIGIESANREALLEVRKDRNLALDVPEAVRKIHAHGMSVFGAFMVGLDSDDVSAFDQIFDYAQQLGIPAVQVKQVCAVKGTELYDKMLAAGRIDLHAPHSAVIGLDESNLIFKNIPIDEMNARHRALFHRLYSPAAFYERVRTFIAGIEHCRPAPTTKAEFSDHVLLAIPSYLLLMTARLRFDASYHFLKSLVFAWRRHGFSRAVTVHVLRFAFYDFAVDYWISSRPALQATPPKPAMSAAGAA